MHVKKVDRIVLLPLTLELFPVLRVWNADAVQRWEFCLSVSLTNACIVTKWKKDLFRFFIPYERSFSLVFWEEEWLVGRPLLPEMLGQPAFVGAKSPILNRYYLVAPQP